MRKKFISIIVSMSMILSCMGTAGVSFAAEKTANKAFAGSTIGTATPISFGNTYNGSITKTGDKNFYKFILPTSGKINLKSTGYINSMYYRIYDASGNEIYEKFLSKDSTTDQISYNENFDLTSGTYYLCAANITYGNITGKYNFKLSFTSANESFKEGNGINNNSLGKANTISLNTTYKGQIAENDEKDFYKFNLSTSGKIKLSLQAGIDTLCYGIYDKDGNEIKYRYMYDDNSTKQISYSEEIDLTSGTYYLCINQGSYHTGNYNFKIGFTSANESFKEGENTNNNSLGKANTISLNTTYKGQIAENDEKDFYKFNLSTSGKIKLSLQADIDTLYYGIYDKDGNEIKHHYMYHDYSTNKISYSEEIDLASGTYYLCIDQCGTKTGNYSFALKSQHNNAESTLKLTNANYPTTIKEGSPFTLKGTISSNYKITLVKVQVLNSYGSTVSTASKTVYPNAYSYSNIDAGIKFGTLSAGDYTYQIIAKDASGTQKTLLDKKFVVKADTPTPKPPTPITKTGVTTGTLNVRSGPATSYTKLGTLSKGTTVQIVGQDSSTGWYKIKYKSGYGYISNKYVKLNQGGGETPTPSPTTKTGVTTGTLNVRKGPSTSYTKLGTLSKGSTVQIVGQDSSTGWYKIKYKSGYGYISNKYVKLNQGGGETPTPSPTTKTGVTTGTLNVRKGPATSYAKLGTLSKGTTVQIVGQDSSTGWYKIKYKSGYGYISYKYVKLS